MGNNSEQAHGKWCIDPEDEALVMILVLLGFVRDEKSVFLFRYVHRDLNLAVLKRDASQNHEGYTIHDLRFSGKGIQYTLNPEDMITLVTERTK